jgi:hypothetical protein
MVSFVVMLAKRLGMCVKKADDEQETPPSSRLG